MTEMLVTGEGLKKWSDVAAFLGSYRIEIHKLRSLMG